MSSNTGNLTEADLVPGAFPSEDTIIENEQTTHNPQASSFTSTNTTGGDEELAKKARDFAKQQKAAHTSGGQKTDKYIPASQQENSRTGAGSHPGQNSEAWTDVSNPETLLRNADGKEAPTPSSPLGQTSGTRHQASSTPEAGVDLSSVGSGLATTATALGLAAKDALAAAAEAAGPAASAATEQAKNLAGYAQENAAPAASYTRDTVASGVSSASQQAGSLTTSSNDTVPTDGVLGTANTAASYAKDAASNAASTAQSYAPNVLGEPASTGSSARGVASESQMEKEMLGQNHSQSQESTKKNSGSTSRAKGLSLEEQLMPDSLTPGVAKVMGTEHDRSFPLGVTQASS